MEYMRSVRRRNLLNRIIVIGVGFFVIVLAIVVLPAIRKTDAKNDSPNEAPELYVYEPIITNIKYEIQEGDTLLAILQLEVGVSYEDSLGLIEKVNELFDITKIRLGSVFTITFADEELASISYDINTSEELIITTNEEGFDVVREPIVFDIQEAFAEGVVEDSLYASGLDVGLTDRMIMELAGVFAWDVDFTSSIREGDTYSLFFENKYRDGEFAGTGDLIAARFVNDGHEFFTYLVKDAEGHNLYYNEEGEATERLLLKTPLNYKRISSGYTLNRKHPILGTFAKHRAIDFAADTGTPVETVGDGVVVYAGWHGAHGNYVKIQHGSGFDTAYAHLSKIYVSKGTRVKQGDLIGAVGSTGRSTGPHLHYEMYKNGGLVDPLNTDTPAGKPISEELRPELDAMVSMYKDRLQIEEL